MIQTETYFETASAAMEAVVNRLAAYDATTASDFRDEFNGIEYGETRSRSFSLDTFRGKPTRKGLQVTLYRLETGRYELTTYFL